MNIVGPIVGANVAAVLVVGSLLVAARGGRVQPGVQPGIQPGVQPGIQPGIQPGGPARSRAAAWAAGQRLGPQSPQNPVQNAEKPQNAENDRGESQTAQSLVKGPLSGANRPLSLSTTSPVQSPVSSTNSPVSSTNSPVSSTNSPVSSTNSSTMSPVTSPVSQGQGQGQGQTSTSRMDKWYEEPVRFERPPGGSEKGSVMLDKRNGAMVTLVHEVYKIAYEEYVRGVERECSGYTWWEEVKGKYDGVLEEKLEAQLEEANEAAEAKDKIPSAALTAMKTSTLEADVTNVLSYPALVPYTAADDFFVRTLGKYRMLAADVGLVEEWEEVKELESLIVTAHGKMQRPEDSLLFEGTEAIEATSSVEEVKRKWKFWKEAEKAGQLVGQLRAKACKDVLEDEKGT